MPAVSALLCCGQICVGGSARGGSLDQASWVLRGLRGHSVASECLREESWVAPPLTFAITVAVSSEVPVLECPKGSKALIIQVTLALRAPLEIDLNVDSRSARQSANPHQCPDFEPPAPRSRAPSVLSRSLSRRRELTKVL